MLDLRSLGLKTGDLVLLDTAPLVYLIEGAPTDRDRSRVVEFFADRGRSGDLRLTASVLVWTEGLAGPLELGDLRRAEAMRIALSNSATLVLEPLDVSIAEEAARLLALRSGAGKTPRRLLEFADAIHLATAATRGAAAVLTNDGAWRGAVEAAAADPSRRGDPYRRLSVLLVDELTYSVD